MLPMTYSLDERTMDKQARRALERGKHQIARRLNAAAHSNENGPVISGSNIHYEVAEKTRGISAGGIGAVHKMVCHLGLADEIDKTIELLKFHCPYYESDHVLNLAYNALCGGRCLDDIELRRMDAAFLDAIGAQSIPDPTTAGDFCRRFEEDDVIRLMTAVNKTRLKVWKAQDDSFITQTARIDADGTIVETSGECKDGMDIAYNGKWGYSTLLITLAATAEPLFIVNRSGNRPSHELAVPYLDRSIELCREAGFTDILLRGDTDFSLTENFDRWTADGVRFIFGYDAVKNLIRRASGFHDSLYEDLVKRAERALKTKSRGRPENVKERIVREREFKNIRLKSEEIVEFGYRPTKCKQQYRIVALRKNLSIERGDNALFDEVRYYFFVTNDWNLSAHEVVLEAHQRCNQENIIEQLKNGVRALHAPVNTLNANWAYMAMTALAWSLKAWMALLLPICPRWKEKHLEERENLLRMEFRTFLNALINVPCQIVKTGRRIVYRLLSWNPWAHVMLRFLDAT